MPLTDDNIDRTTLASIGNATIVVFDEHLRVLRVYGRTILGRIGLAPETVVGKHLYEIASRENREAAARIYRDALAGTVGSKAMMRAGRRIFVQAEPVRWQDGTIVGCVGIWVDITDLPPE